MTTAEKKLAKIPTTSQVSSASELESESEFYADTSESLASLNQCLGEIGETPVNKRKLQQTMYLLNPLQSQNKIYSN